MRAEPRAVAMWQARAMKATSRDYGEGVKAIEILTLWCILASFGLWFPACPRCAPVEECGGGARVRGSPEGRVAVDRIR